MIFIANVDDNKINTWWSERLGCPETPEKKSNLWLTGYLKVKVAQSCPTLWNPMDYTVPRILQARILEWVAMPSSRGSSQPRDWTQVTYILGRFFTSRASREALDTWSGTFPFIITVLYLEKEMAPHSSILATEFHGQGSLVDYGPWDCKESHTTERLNWTEPIFKARILVWYSLFFNNPTSPSFKYHRSFKLRGFSGSSAGKEYAGNAGDLGSIPGLGRSFGEGKGYPLQYSGLENSMDCIGHEVTKSQTQLSD